MQASHCQRTEQRDSETPAKKREPGEELDRQQRASEVQAHQAEGKKTATRRR